MAANAPGKKIPADLSDRLVIGPERARRQFIELIEQARSSIRIMSSMRRRRSQEPWSWFRVLNAAAAEAGTIPAGAVDGARW